MMGRAAHSRSTVCEVCTDTVAFLPSREAAADLQAQTLRAPACKRYDLFVARAHLDPTDEAILALLVEDGRRSASEVGRRVGLSPAAAKRRIDRLEESGVVTGYTAIIDHTKLGSEIEAFAEVRFQAGAQVGDIDEAFTTLPELVESFTTAGDPDGLVRLRVTDLDHLKRVIDRIRRTGQVVGTKTLIVLGSRRGSG